MTTKTTKFHVPDFEPLSNEALKALKLSFKQSQILFGSLLGDFRLQSQSYRIRAQQNFEKNGLYLLHLFDIFKPFCSSLPDKVERKTKLFETTDLRFQTRVHSEFTQFGKMFYDNKNKHLPPYDIVYSWLTPTAVAYWYMDDGGSEKSNPRACVFSTHSFTDNETERLISILNQKYKLKAYSKFNKGRKVISVPAESCDRFNELFKPERIESMYYKLPGHRKKE